MAHRFAFAGYFSPGVALVLCVASLTLVGCESTEPIDTASANDPVPDSEEELLELYKAPDDGHRALVLAYIEALRLGDVARLSGMLTEYARNEIEVQHKSLEAYVATAQRNIAQHELRIRFDSPFQHYAKLDAGVFFEVWFGETLHFAFYIEKDKETLKIDNILVSVRTRIFVFERIAPAIGMALDKTQLSFMCYYYGAIFGEHPAAVLAERADSPASDLERLAYLRLCSTSPWMERIKSDPQARGNVLGFLDTGKRELQKFSEPIDIASDEMSYTCDITEIESKQTARVTYTFRREHGVYRILGEERKW